MKMIKVGNRVRGQYTVEIKVDGDPMTVGVIWADKIQTGSTKYVSSFSREYAKSKPHRDLVEALKAQPYAALVYGDSSASEGRTSGKIKAVRAFTGLKVEGDRLELDLGEHLGRVR